MKRKGTRSFLKYGLVMAGIMMIYTIVSLYYISQNEKKSYLKNVDYECGTMATEVQAISDNISNMTTFLLAEPDMLSAVRYLTRKDVEKNPVLKNHYLGDIKAALANYYITKYYYRVSYINNEGDFVTSSQWLSNYSGMDKIIEIVSQNFSREMGKKVEYYGIYQDPWSKKEQKQIAGFVKKISGNDRGFFEIQMEENELYKIFQKEFSTQTLVNVQLNGMQIYESEKWPESLTISDSSEHIEKTGWFLTARTYETGLGTLKIYCAARLWNMAKGTWGIYISVLIIMIFFMAWTYLFLKRYIRKLVIPINVLKERMDKTDIQNLVEFQNTSDEQGELAEITSLKKGYNRLIVRIKEGMAREKKLEGLQTQANLDTLQAQVNPHFINNTLSVISYRGILLGDDDICEACNCLSSMMKFAANTKKRIVTIREELDYVESYMELLRYRYQDKFHYEIQVERQLYMLEIPKIVIQQLVENSISHGYHTPHDKMNITIRGWTLDGWWYIRVQDNGDGFREEVREQLHKQMKEMRKMILEENRIGDVKIGGMGIINIYARLLLLHKEMFRLDIENLENGAQVTLGSVIAKQDEERIND